MLVAHPYLRPRRRAGCAPVRRPWGQPTAVRRSAGRLPPREPRRHVASSPSSRPCWLVLAVAAPAARPRRSRLDRTRRTRPSSRPRRRSSPSRSPRAWTRARARSRLSGPDGAVGTGQAGQGRRQGHDARRPGPRAGRLRDQVDRRLRRTATSCAGSCRSRCVEPTPAPATTSPTPTATTERAATDAPTASGPSTAAPAAAPDRRPHRRSRRAHAGHRRRTSTPPRSASGTDVLVPIARGLVLLGRPWIGLS